MVRPVLSFFNVVDVKGYYLFLFPRHQHFNYQLIFAVRGSYRCLLNDQALALRPRDILIVKSGASCSGRLSLENLRELKVEVVACGA